MPTIDELQSRELAKDEWVDQTTKYKFEGKEYPLLQKHSISALCKDILSLNEKAEYVSVLMSGKSSSGKSTLTQTIIHRISCMNPEGRKYIVKWFTGKDLHKLDEVIDSLQKGLQYILVFDDVSFVLDQAPPKKRKELAEKLTRIRHDVKGKVITFMNVHYGRSILPIFRDSYFRILTSMSSEDQHNWKESFGWENAFLIQKFQKQFASQMQHGYFYINNIQGEKSYCYYTDKPFRIALISDMNNVHPLVYPKEGCRLCSPINKPHKQQIGAESIWEELSKTYTNRAKPALQYWLYFVKGKKDALPADKVRAVNFLTKLLEKYDTDVDHLEKIAIDQKFHYKRRSYTFKDKDRQMEERIVKSIEEKSLES